MSRNPACLVIIDYRQISLELTLGKQPLGRPSIWWKDRRI